MINNTYKPLASLSPNLAPLKSVSGLSGPATIPGLTPLSSKTAPAPKPATTTPTATPVSGLAQTPPTQMPTASGGNVTYINGGAAYSNPADNPNFKGTQPTTASTSTTPTTPITQSGTTAPIKGLFPDVVSSLTSTSQNNPTDSVIKALVDKATQPNDAFDIANNRLQDFRNKYANQLANNSALPLGVEEQTGRESIYARQAAAQEAALQAAVGNTLSQQTLSQQGLINAGQIGNTARQIGITGLGTAAGLAQPQVTGFGQTSFNPVTGSFGGGSSNLDPQATANDLAQKVAAGQMTYEQAVSSLGYAGSAGQQFLNNALKQINPNFNPSQSTATIGANAGVVQQATGDISNMQTNLSAADTNLAQLTSLAAQNGINDLSSVTANKIANLFKGEFSNQALLSFNALIAGTRALYAAVLESRANLAPTDAYNAAIQQVPDNVNLGALKNLTGTLKTEAQNIIAAKQQQIQSAGGSQSGNSTTNSGGFSEGQTTSSGGYNFVYKNGQWVAQ